MKPLHYHTSNTALAQALEMCGAKLVDTWNVYTPEILRKLGFPNARSAREAGKPGRITYYFEKTPLLVGLLKVWDETQAKIDKGENLTVDPDPEDVMRIACATLKQRNAFANHWKQVTPMVEEQKPGDTVTEKVGDETRIKMPGFRLVSINASKETKERLKF